MRLVCRRLPMEGLYTEGLRTDSRVIRATVVLVIMVVRAVRAHVVEQFNTLITATPLAGRGSRVHTV